MSGLDDYRKALLAAFPDVSGDELAATLDVSGEQFARFVIDHGLGPLWHERTGHDSFRGSRMQAEALFLAQEKSLAEVGEALDMAGIAHIAIKGAANRLVAYDNPAVRACHDIDVLVHPRERVSAAKVLADLGYSPAPKSHNISHEMMLTRGNVDIDLHWRLLREGRLRNEDIAGLLSRRRRVGAGWVPSAEDAAFLLLVHPALVKHVSGWEMGLHRVADIVAWFDLPGVNWDAVLEKLAANGVRTAAWATLRWVDLLSMRRNSPTLYMMLSRLQPGTIRRSWLNFWLRNNLSSRTSRVHKLRLLVFSLALHDGPSGAWRAIRGRYQAHRRREADLSEFRDLERQ